MKFNRFILFGGKIGEWCGYHGMEQALISTPDEKDLLKYIIKHKLSNDGSWYQIFDCMTSEIILEYGINLESESGLREDTGKIIRNDTIPSNLLGHSIIHTEVDDTGFEYNDIKVGDKFKTSFKDGLPISLQFEAPRYDTSIISGVVRNIINKNKKQLVTVSFALDKNSFNEDAFYFIYDDAIVGAYREANEIEVMEMI